MLPGGLRTLLESHFPGARITEAVPLGADARVASSVTKAAGYGAPLRITLTDAGGTERVLVFRTATANDFGHDRRSDRAEQLLLAFDTFGQIPRHVAPVDVGAIAAGDKLHSLQDAGEFYLLTTFAPGALYAQDLRRIAECGKTPLDETRALALARYLAELHTPIPDGRPALYRRAIRDLVGHGEGIFGILGDYPDEVPGASPERLAAIEQACVSWRWRLRGHEPRLRRTHGDFHPFNVVFERGAEFGLLDAARGCKGDPADDVSCMAINYVFFALPGGREAWRSGLGSLWQSFWDTYLHESGDRDLLSVVAPFLAWRLLVLCSPRWYPGVLPDHRDRLLGLAERALRETRFEPSWAEELFA